MKLTHPEDEDILRYLQDGLSQEHRQSLEVHIGGCPECAGRFAELYRLSALVHQQQENPEVDVATKDRARGIIQERGSTWKGRFTGRPRFRLALAGSAFALLLALYLFLPMEESQQFRSDEHAGLGTFVLFPEDGATVTNAATAFRWTSLGSQLVYQISLLEATGEVLWRTDTPDTSMTIPQSVVLQPGKTYLWRVETSFADKTLERSALHAFTYAPQ